MSLAVPESVARQAEQLRLNGNSYFKKDRILAAIDAYTEAITLCPDVAVYRTNRALCFLKQKEWARVEEDCRNAIKLDKSSVKAHYLLGLALLERRDYTEGIKELEKAFDLGKHPSITGFNAEDLWQALARAKYMEWEDLSSKRTCKLETLKEACEKALTEYYFLHDIEPYHHTSTECDEQLHCLKEVINQATQADMPTEVPDYLCCKITLDIFHDPVIAPSGITYERSVIIDHLQKVGNFDPITREPLVEHQLVPNLAIRQAVQAFLSTHGWAYKLILDST